MGDDTPQLPKGQSRGMTPGEIEMAKTIFGNGLDYSKIRIHNGKDEGLATRAKNVLSSFIGMKNVESRPQTAQNDIYFPTDQYCDDFSKSASKGTFIHELTHVWQWQHKLAGPAVQEVQDVVMNGFNYDKTYSYKIDPKKDLMDYNIEQQGDIVEEYFGMKERKAHPEPPAPPATPESMEASFFGKMMLKKAAADHVSHSETPQQKDWEKNGYLAYDSEGHAHFTQKFADRTNEDTKKYEAERVQREAGLEKVMAKFVADPNYVDKPGPFAVAAEAALKAAVPVMGVSSAFKNK